VTAKTSVSSTTSTNITLSQISDAASSVKAFFESNKRLPNYVTISTMQVTMPQFLQLLTEGLLKVSSGSKTAVVLEEVEIPESPYENVKSGNIVKTDYLSLAQKIETFIDSNGRAPNFVTSSLGKIRYESMVYMYSRIMSYYDNNNKLPSYVAITPWSSAQSTIPAELKPYIQPTANCQSDNAAIKSLASSLTSSLSSTYDKATAIFNWVRDNLSYSFYYNTVRGAVGTLNDRTGNCVDHSHLLIALSRAAGIPARYVHGICNFSSGTYGHVWAQLYVDGKWYSADAISNSNSFGVIRNWDTSNYILKGTYLELPF
jgi:hypothetical protein